MRCDDVRSLLPDLLDDLLEPAQASEIQTHLDACGGCRDAQCRAAEVREVLYKPWDVVAPAGEAAPSSAPSSVPLRATRLAVGLLRYAAVFVAGLLAARLLTTNDVSSPPSSPASVPAPAAVAAPLPAAALADYPRRIR